MEYFKFDTDEEFLGISRKFSSFQKCFKFGLIVFILNKKIKYFRKIFREPINFFISLYLVNIV